MSMRLKTCPSSAQAAAAAKRRASNRELYQHCVVIGACLIVASVLIWLAYFGPLA